MDDTPPPDIPNPDSPTPATPARRRPRHIEPRLTNYADEARGDMNWRRGVAMLWAIFLLIAIGEALHVVFYLLTSGGAPWPRPINLGPSLVLPLDAIVVCAEAVLFLTLWLGWSWTRWLMVILGFLYGAWMVMWTITGGGQQEGPPSQFGSPQPAPMHSVITLPGLLLGLVYLASAAYLAFSADVIGFTRHRRTEGRWWVILPLALIVGGYVYLFLTADVYYRQWLEGQKPQAQQFAEDSLRAFSERWDPAAYDARGSEESLKSWTVDQRRGTFGTMSAWGKFEGVTGPKVVMTTGPDPSGEGFRVDALYRTDKAQFAQASGPFDLEVVRGVFGPWKVNKLMPGDIKPASTPAPPVPEATPAPETMATPGATPAAGAMPTPGAAPTAGASATPTP